MSDPARPDAQGLGRGRLVDNLMHFGRVLRAAGLPLGTDRIELALRALPLAGLGGRRELRDVLAATLVDRVEHLPLFDQAFTLFWRDPDLAGRLLAAMLPQVQAKTRPADLPENRRLADALFPQQPDAARREAPREQIEVDAAMTWNERELLRKADFETMTAEEWRAAQRLLREMAPLFAPLPSRRLRASTRPRQLDARATLREAARHGGDLVALRWRSPRQQPPRLVVLADISGSMSRYSRMLLHFAHVLAGADAKVESFVFGTRLTRITRALRHRDPDLAVAQAVAAVADWSGGTRISASLQAFNRQWARRVLDSRATLLLISDGLEQPAPDDPDSARLGFEMERLHKSCRRLLWLNPLLRYSGFQPRAGGIRAMRPHVDEFLPVHNLDSLAALARRLAAPGPGPV